MALSLAFSSFRVLSFLRFLGRPYLPPSTYFFFLWQSLSFIETRVWVRSTTIITRKPFPISRRIRSASTGATLHSSANAPFLPDNRAITKRQALTGTVALLRLRAAKRKPLCFQWCKKPLLAATEHASSVSEAMLVQAGDFKGPGRT